MKKILLILCLLPLVAVARTMEEKWILCTNVNCQILDSYYEDGVSYTWDGGVSNNKAHGQGTAVRYVNGELHSTFVGLYENGKRTGKGTVTWPSGEVLECEFKDNLATGMGVQIWPNGDKYEGAFINGGYHGMGKYVKVNGDVYEGYFVRNVVYTGKRTTVNGTTTYYYKGQICSGEMPEEKVEYNPIIGEVVTEFFDADWKRCTINEASYYRRIKYKAPNVPDGEVRDYYITGTLQAVFNAAYVDYADDNKIFYEGSFVQYYKNGNKKEEGTYYANKLDGKYVSYYKNGTVGTIVDYKDGIRHGEYYDYYMTGKLHHYALYEYGNLLEDKYVELDENGVGYIVYKEYFGSHPDYWVSAGDGQHSDLIEWGSKVSLTNELSNSMVQRSVYIPFDQSQDYMIEAKVSCDDNVASYGLVFGFKDWDNFYCFLIHNTGHYSVRGSCDGVDRKLREWTKYDKIYAGKENTLRVFKRDNQFIFTINGEPVAQVPAENLRGNRFGMLISGSATMVLSSLSVNEYAELTHPQDAYPTSLIPSGKPDAEGLAQAGGWLWSGTGFFISEKGYIATNYHVVDNATQLQVTYKQNGQTKTYKAEVVVSDPTNDLAIIKIVDNSFEELPEIPYVFTANTEDVGTTVFALGYPKTQKLGGEIKYTNGTISAKTGARGDVRLYQITVPITYGNSGGPLFDENGNLVGITSSGWENEDNINYAIKSTYLKNLVEVLPETINLPNSTSIKEMSLVDKIKVLSEYVPYIEAK